MRDPLRVRREPYNMTTMFQDRAKDGEKKQRDHEPTETSSADRKRHEGVGRKPDNQ